MFAIKPSLQDSKAMSLARNRLANALTTIPAQAANEKGLPALRVLLASAPDLDSPSEFIPQQRAIFLLRHLGSWLASDDADDLDEEVEVRLAELCTALAPIVQSVAGGHWDIIFDLVESGLEVRRTESQ